MKQKKSFHVQRQLIMMIALKQQKRLRADSIGKFLSTNNGSESVSIARADGKSLVVAERILVNPQLLRDVDERKKLKLIIKRRIFRENFL